jgi:hypothetical protein
MSKAFFNYDGSSVNKSAEILTSQVEKVKTLNISFHNEALKLILINETLQREIELFLYETHFTYEKYTTENLIQSRSKSIYVKERDSINGEVLILYNKKGLDMEKMKDYTQFEVIFTLKEYNKEINIFMEDLKILVELSLIAVLSDFFKLPETKPFQNVKENSLRNFKKLASKLQINSKEEIVVKLCIVNNIVFMRSEPHMKSQRILAAEGDILLDLTMSSNSNSQEFYASLNLSNVYYYSTKRVQVEV